MSREDATAAPVAQLFLESEQPQAHALGQSHAGPHGHDGPHGQSPAFAFAFAAHGLHAHEVFFVSFVMVRISFDPADARPRRLLQATSKKRTKRRKDRGAAPRSLLLRQVFRNVSGRSWRGGRDSKTEKPATKRRKARSNESADHAGERTATNGDEETLGVDLDADHGTSSRLDVADPVADLTRAIADGMAKG